MDTNNGDTKSSIQDETDEQQLVITVRGKNSSSIKALLIRKKISAENFVIEENESSNTTSIRSHDTNTPKTILKTLNEVIRNHHDRADNKECAVDEIPDATKISKPSPISIQEANII